MVHEGDSKLCRAVPPFEVLAQLKSTFLKRRSEALTALSGLTGLSSDFGVYQLGSRAQALQRFHVMLKACKEIAICTIFPRLMEEVKSDLEAAAKRGVRIAVTVYEPVTVKGVDVVLEPRRQEVLKRWPGQWLNAVVDGKEHLIALLADDGANLHHALWSGNVYLSWIYHSAVSAALIGTVLSKHVEEGASQKVLREKLRHFRKFLEGEGYRMLPEQFFATSTNPRKQSRSQKRLRKRKPGVK